MRAILDAPDETCFLSSRELARRYNVDAATIVRTVKALGYDTFADFTADLRQHLLTRLTPYTVLKAATEQGRSVEDHVNRSFDKSVESVSALNSEADRANLIEIARTILNARRVLVVGVDFAVSLAHYLAYGLLAIGVDAEAHEGSTGYLQHKVEVLTPKDILIGISFGQCLRDTVEAVLLAKRRGIPTLGITDSDTTPIARYTDTHLIASVMSPSFIASYVGPTALISALHVACAHVYPKRSLKRLRPTDKEYISGRRWYRESKSTDQTHG